MFETKKKPVKKLSLNRETLRNLTSSELGNVHGGIKSSEPMCGSECNHGQGSPPPTCGVPIVIGI